jgi:hypothetical protein
MKLKLASINQLYTSTKGVILRFPLAVLSTFVAALTSMYLLEQDYSDGKNLEPFIKLLITCALALPLFISVTLITETINIDSSRKIIFYVVAFILVFLYYWHFDNKIQTSDYIRTYVLIIALHLFVAYSPYIRNYNENGFWQFNKTLFLRFLLSALYSGVIFSGLSIALLAIDNLFHIKIDEKIYFHLWIVISIVFNTLFFLSGIPQDIRELDRDTNYPKGLKVFTQFVLLPLVSVYLLILYVYGFKIVALWVLPRGWVSYLIMCFSVVGIFSLLMIHPVKDDEQNKWINVYSRWFFRLLLPLLILLVIAIYVRVKNYGITENRYFLIALTIWLMVTNVYFLISKKKKISWIPISLSIVALLSVFGPWGAFAISEKSQIERLENLLVENNILQNGKIVLVKDTISYKSEAEIASIIRYLDQTHGYKNIQKWFDKDLEKLFAEKDSVDGYVYKPEIVLNQMGLQNNFGWRVSDGEDYTQNFNYYSTRDANIEISGYDEMIQINANSYDEFLETKFLYLTSDTLKFTYNTLKDTYLINKANGDKLVEFGMNDFVREIKEKTALNSRSNDKSIPANLMYKEIKTENYRFKIFVRSIYGQIKDNKIKVEGFDALLLIAYPQNVR